MYLHEPHRTHHLLLQNYLETVLPIQVIAHLTFPFPVSRACADLHFTDWRRAVQRFHRTTIAFILAYEQAPGIQLHLHCALVAGRSLDVKQLCYLWKLRHDGRHDTVKADHYQPRAGGLAYDLKADDEDCCDVRFSDNLDLFGRTTVSGSANLNARGRRQLRRVMGPGDR